MTTISHCEQGSGDGWTEKCFCVMWFTFTFRSGFLSFGLCSWFLLFLLLSSWQALQATGRLSPFYIVICFPVWKHHQLCWEQDVCLSLSASCSTKLIDWYIFLSGLGCLSHTHRGVFLGLNSQVLQKFVPHTVDYYAEAGCEQILSTMSPVLTVINIVNLFKLLKAKIKYIPGFSRIINIELTYINIKFRNIVINSPHISKPSWP